MPESKQSARKRCRIRVAREGDEAFPLRLGRERLKHGHRPAEIVLQAPDLGHVEVSDEPVQQLREEVRHPVENSDCRLQSQSVRAFGEHQDKDAHRDRAAKDGATASTRTRAFAVARGMMRPIAMAYTAPPRAPTIYSIVARREAPTLTFVTTMAVSTAHNPCRGKAKLRAIANAERPATVIGIQKRNCAL